MYLKICQSDPAKFLSYARLAWQVALTKAELKLGLLTNIDMLLMAEKGIGGEKCNPVSRYGKATNKNMKDYDKNKKSSYIKYCDVTDLYDWEKWQYLPVNGYELGENILNLLKALKKL